MNWLVIEELFPGIFQWKFKCKMVVAADIQFPESYLVCIIVSKLNAHASRSIATKLSLLFSCFKK